jgi:Cohesin domain
MLRNSNRRSGGATLPSLLLAAALAGALAAATAQSAPGGDGTLGAWPQREPLGEPRGDPFAVPARARAPRPAAKPPAQPAAPVAPVAPPMPYRVAGSLVTEGVRQVLLAKGDAVFPIEPGELLEGNYRVDSINDEAVSLVYLPLDVRESLPLLAGIAAPRTARVRWDGPERVQIGAPFKVILRVTADEPLHATPLELSFDAEVLEPVSVQPGKAFDAAGFAHRISTDGSIVVGSSRRGAEPVNAVADAELVVFVFKAIRAAEATELRLASLVLEGAVGKPLPLEPPGAYRAMVAP